MSSQTACGLILETLLPYQQLPRLYKVACGEAIKIETTRDFLTYLIFTIPIHRTCATLVDTRKLDDPNSNFRTALPLAS